MVPGPRWWRDLGAVLRLAAAVGLRGLEQRAAAPLALLVVTERLDGDVMALGGLAQRADGGLPSREMCWNGSKGTSASRSRRSSC